MLKADSKGVGAIKCQSANFDRLCLASNFEYVSLKPRSFVLV